MSAGGSVEAIPEASPADLAPAAERARAYAGQAKAPNTLRAYNADWRDFAAWCAAAGLAPLPAEPETVGLYLGDLAAAGRKASTLERRLSAISQAHRLAGHPSPTGHPAVRAVWAGIRRAHDAAQEGKAPALASDMRARLSVPRLAQVHRSLPTRGATARRSRVAARSRRRCRATRRRC